MLKQVLLGLLQLDITDTELEDGTEVRNLRVEPGRYPCACRGYVVAEVNGRQVRYRYALPCQECGGCH